MSPSEYFNDPVIGWITVKGFKINSTRVSCDGPVSTFEVIRKTGTVYVTNKWSDEEARIPQLVPVSMVIDFEKY